MKVETVPDCTDEKLKLELEQAKLYLDKEKLEFDRAKYLHEHTWKRLMWWRDELWKVTIPVWTAFGTLNATVLAISINEKGSLPLYRAAYIWIGLFGFGVIIMRVYAWYVKTVYEAVSVLNKSMKICEDDIDRKKRSSYALHVSVPGLPELFYLVGFVLILVAAGITFNSVQCDGVDIDHPYFWLISIVTTVPLMHLLGLLLFAGAVVALNLRLIGIIPWLSNKISRDHICAKRRYKSVNLAHKEHIKEKILCEFRNANSCTGDRLPQDWISNYETTLNPKEKEALRPAIDDLVAERYIVERENGLELTAEGVVFIY